MIPFPFAYYAAETLDEALSAYQECAGRGETPLYAGGGTEIITMGRVNSLSFDALISLKAIPELAGLLRADGRLILGAGETLNAIACWNAFPLLSKCCARVADHTAQCKITLGGNIAGTVIYHEALLPLLLSDAQAELYGPGGHRAAPLASLFTPGLSLKPGEFFVRFSLAESKTGLPFVHAKHVNSEKIGYPLLTLAAIREGDTVTAAISGLYRYPLLLRFPYTGVLAARLEMEAQLSSQLPGPPLDDLMGTGAYRLFWLQELLAAMMERFLKEAS